MATAVITMWGVVQAALRVATMAVETNMRYWMDIMRKEHQIWDMIAPTVVMETEAGRKEEFAVSRAGGKLTPEDLQHVLAVHNVRYSPAKGKMETEYGTAEVIFDSGSGLSIFPGEWVQRFGETLRLRPSTPRIKAGDGGGVGLAGCMPMKVRPPGTTAWMVEHVEVGKPGAMPEHIKIMGNSWMKAVNAKIDYATDTLTGTTPAGEQFSIPIHFGGKRHRTMTAVALEVSETQEAKDHGSSCIRTDRAICLEPLQGQAVRLRVPDSIQGTEGDQHQGDAASAWLWSPTTMKRSTEETDQGDETDFIDVEISTMAVVQMEQDGGDNQSMKPGTQARVINYWVHNPTDQTLYVSPGTALGWIEQVQLGTPAQDAQEGEATDDTPIRARKP
jgi:hypothetical protein